MICLIELISINRGKSEYTTQGIYRSQSDRSDNKLMFIKIYQSMQIFSKALKFASLKHQNQRRKQAGDVPYINHPIEVADILIRAGVKDTNVLAAALLHDTVEDTQTTEAEL